MNKWPENEEFKCQSHPDPTCSDVVAGKKLFAKPVQTRCQFKDCHCKRGFAVNANNECVAYSKCLQEKQKVVGAKQQDPGNKLIFY
uniref:TIL domain-containing protein n=1 Tax=Romanomermis culicivorax TaxID=13658 RepID=A0A915LA53_ROMCU